jgi:hypothetical protein
VGIRAFGAINQASLVKISFIVSKYEFMTPWYPGKEILYKSRISMG